MPKVPTYSPQVQEAPLPSARITTTVSPQSQGLGIGQGLTEIGKTIQEERKKADEIIILDSDRELGEWENEAIYHPESGALNKRGRDSFGLPEEIQEAYRKKSSEIEGRLTSNNQKLKFRKLVVGRERAINRTVQRHVSQQMKAFEDQSTEDYIKSTRANAAFNYTDPERIGIEIAKQRMAISAWAKRNGLPADQKMKNAVSQTHAQVIERMLVNDEDQLAKGYFRDNKEDISGEHIADIEKALEAGSLRGESQRKADEIINTTPDATKRLDKAGKIRDPKLRDEVERRIIQDNSRRDQLVAQEQRQAKDDSWEVIAGGGGRDQIPVTTWAKLNGTEQQNIITYLNKRDSGQDIDTNWEVYYGLARMEPNQLADVNLNDHRNDLSNAEFKQVTAWQRAIQKARQQGVAPEGTSQQLIKATLEQQPMNDKLKGEFTSKALIAIDNEQQDLGRKLNTAEKQQIIDNLVIEGELHRDWLWDPNKRAFEIETKDERQRFYVSDVPPPEREKIEEALRRQKVPVSDENVMRLYNQKLQLQMLKGQ